MFSVLDAIPRHSTDQTRLKKRCGPVPILLHIHVLSSQLYIYFAILPRFCFDVVKTNIWGLNELLLQKDALKV